jgi:ribose transport system ATP-binding protein
MATLDSGEMAMTIDDPAPKGGSTRRTDRVVEPAQDHQEDQVSALKVHGVSKSFNGITVLHSFQLEIGRGQVHMLLGQNGSGKSTLIKVLSGYHVPDDSRADCLVAGKRLEFGNPGSATQLGLRFVHQDLGLIDSESIADNILIGQRYPTRWGTIDNRALRRASTAALERVGLDLDPRTKVGELSAAQRTGVAIARALRGWERSCEVIVLDEPTATLPVQEVEQLHDILRTVTATGIGALYVTHDLGEVHAIGDQVSILRDGRVVASSAVAEMDRETMVHRLVGKEVEAVQREAHDHIVVASSKPTLSVTSLSTDVLRNVDFAVSGGEVVGVYGLTGSGRESILGALFGSVQRKGGSVSVNGRRVAPFDPVAAIAAGVAYVPPDRKTQGGFMLLSATDNLSITDLRSISGAGGAISAKREREQVVKWFDQLEVRPAAAYAAPLGTFSGGNQQKIVMAKWLRRTPAVLLLDEPTQGVDVGAKAQLHRQILAAADNKTAVVVSSTDVPELATLCSRVLILRQGRLVGELRGAAVTEDHINRAIHSEADL